MGRGGKIAIPKSKKSVTIAKGSVCREQNQEKIKTRK